MIDLDRVETRARGLRPARESIFGKSAPIESTKKYEKREYDKGAA